MTELFSSLVEEASSLIDNLRVVSPVLVRGGQPDKQGLLKLKKAGVKTVVNLRYASKPGAKKASSFLNRGGDEKEIEEERSHCEELGLKFINISMDGIESPDPACMQQFVDLFASDQELPIYVHCLYGVERTGLMVASYRLKIEKASPEKAYEEMLACGLAPSRSHLKDLLLKFLDT